jgi:hypothetical protein
VDRDLTLASGVGEVGVSLQHSVAEGHFDDAGAVVEGPTAREVRGLVDVRWGVVRGVEVDLVAGFADPVRGPSGTVAATDPRLALRWQLVQRRAPPSSLALSAAITAPFGRGPSTPHPTGAGVGFASADVAARGARGPVRLTLRAEAGAPLAAAQVPARPAYVGGAAAVDLQAGPAVLHVGATVRRIGDREGAAPSPAGTLARVDVGGVLQVNRGLDLVITHHAVWTGPAMGAPDDGPARAAPWRTTEIGFRARRPVRRNKP